MVNIQVHRTMMVTCDKCGTIERDLKPGERSYYLIEAPADNVAIVEPQHCSSIVIRRVDPATLRGDTLVFCTWKCVLDALQPGRIQPK